MMQLASDVLTKNPAKGTYKDVWGKYIYDIHNLKCSSSIFVMCLFFFMAFVGTVVIYIRI